MRVRTLLPLLLCVLTTCGQPSMNESKKASNPKVCIKTNLGTLTVELAEREAPKTVANFLRYVDEKFYTGTLFHRVIPGFMVQGGGFSSSMEAKKAHATIPNEAANGLKNTRGTLAMARTSEIHSASSQFFINLVDNSFLDYRGPSPQTFGYCVFGQVIEGMEIVDQMAATKTGTKRDVRGQWHENVPLTPLEIVEVTRVH